MKPREEWLIIALSVLVGCALGVACIYIYPLRDFDPASDRRVVENLDLEPDDPRRGFILREVEATKHGAETLPWMQGWIKRSGPVPYTAQFGLMSNVADWLGRATGWGKGDVAMMMRVGQVVLHALAFALLVASVTRARGVLAAGIFCLLCAGWIGFWRWAPSIYWPSALSLAIIAWHVAVPPRRAGLFYGVAFVFFLVRFLCGYEFITSVSLGAVAAAMFGCWLRGEAFPPRSLAGVWLVSVIAFATAFLLHCWKFVGAGADWGEACKLAMLPGSYRTLQGVDEGMLRGVGNLISSILQNGVPAIVLLTLIVMFLGFGWRRQERDGAKARVARPWLIVAAATVSSGSWFVLGYGHAADHPHLCNIVFAQPLLWLLFGMTAVAAAERVGTASKEGLG